MTVGQTESVVVRKQDGLALEGCEVSVTGLTIAEGLPLEKWMECGQLLRQVNGSIQWWLGDWLRHGERKYGEAYSQALEATEYDYQTVADAAWVAGKIQFSRRRENLSWSHHKEVAALEPPDQDAFLQAAIDNGWSRRELRRAVMEHQRGHLPTPSYPPGTFRVIYADPPWKYGDERTLEGAASGAALAAYPVMELDAICDLQDTEGRSIRNLSQPDSVCFLWVTSPLLPEGLKVLEAWGFEYKACFVWNKVRTFNGHYNAVGHELLLIGTRGKGTPDSTELHDSIVTEERTKHSRKPDRFYEIIESMYVRGPYMELFARQKRDGWESWGNQV